MDEERMCILLVEDDPVDRMAFERFVLREKLPYDLIIAETVAEAIRRLQADGIDLVLIDHKLPDGTGLEVQRHVGEIPCIFLSGITDQTIAIEAFKTGAADFLIKDPERQYLQVLPMALENALGHCRARKELQHYRERLEELVERRTARLKEANERLQAEINRRQRVEEALQESEERFRNAFEYAAIGRGMAEPGGRFIRINSAFSKMLGYVEAEMLAKTWMDITHPDDLGKSTEKVRQLMKGIIPAFRLAHRLVHKDGHPIWVDLTVFLIRDADGEPRYLVGDIVDISEALRAQQALREHSERLEEMIEDRTRELKEAQEELMRKEKLALLGQLGGGVAHELRHPLGVISNAVYYLQSCLSNPDRDTEEYLQLINSEVEASKRIINNLLEFSRTRPPKQAPTEVSQLVVQALKRQPAPEQVEVIIQIPEAISTIFVDPQQIGQVLVNLVTNAFEAMPESGVLTIRAQAAGNNAQLILTDSGCGIAKEDLEKIFQPLVSTKPRGTGLGLALSKILVEANRGTIELESEEGKGCRVTLTLPASRTAS